MSIVDNWLELTTTSKEVVFLVEVVTLAVVIVVASVVENVWCSG